MFEPRTKYFLHIVMGMGSLFGNYIQDYTGVDEGPPMSTTKSPLILQALTITPMKGGKTVKQEFSAGVNVALGSS